MSVYGIVKKLYNHFRWLSRGNYRDSKLLCQGQFPWKLFERIVHVKKNLPLRKDFLSMGIEHFPQKNPVDFVSLHELSENGLITAINDLHGKGGVIQIPVGRIVFSQTLNIPTNVILNGVPGKTELVFDELDYGIQFIGHASSQIMHSGLKNLRILHQGEHKFCAAVFASHSAYLSFSNIEIVSPRGVGFLLADDVYGSSFFNCSVSYAALVGFMFIRDVNETRLEACKAEYCRQSGVFLTDLKMPEHLTMMDFDEQLRHTNEIIGNFAPFSVDDPAPVRSTMVNCVFQFNRKMGITTDGVGYLKVINTVLAHNECEGITIDNGSWCCQIQNCHIFDNGRRGFQDEHELNVDFVQEMGLMDDGTSKAKLPGISIDNAAYIRIENNHIESNWGDGVKLVRAGFSCTIANNLIENNNRGVNDKFHFFGVLLGGAERQHPDQDDFPSCNNHIIANDILGQHFSGVHLMPGTTGNRVCGNHIEGATFQSIENHTLTGNEIQE